MADKYIVAYKYGAEFLQCLREEIDLLSEAPDPEKKDPYFFDVSYDLLEAGYRAGEPAMMYLYAEANRGRCDMEPEIVSLYLDAAKHGSVHAMLWLLYCNSQNECSLTTAELSDLKALLNEQTLPSTVILEELHFMEKAYDDLWWNVDVADCKEDVVATDPDYKDLRNDPEAYPNPSWRTLVQRCKALAEYIHLLQLPYCTEDKEYSAYKINNAEGRWIKEEKDGWEEWYRIVSSSYKTGDL